MRQIWISREGSPEELEVRKAPDPEPKPGQIRVLVEAAGVNFADIMARLGLYPDRPALPVVVGYEVAGRVDQIGAGVDPAWLGQDVLALTRFGGYSDVVCTPESQAFERPAGMTALEGAAFPVNYLTAHQLLVVMGNLRPRETVLVHSAGGGCWPRRHPDCPGHRGRGHRRRVCPQARIPEVDRHCALHRRSHGGFRAAHERADRGVRGRSGD